MEAVTATLGGSVDARISGQVSGQIAVGNNIVQYHVEHGGVVNVAAPGERPEPRPRPLPLPPHLRGRRPRRLVGRERELAAGRAALEEGTPLQFHGLPGVGKTSLLKTLAHLHDDPPDGVLYHMGHGEDVEDVRQFLFETFYDTPGKFKATEADLRHGLGGVQARIMVDDLAVGRDELETLLDFLPAATFAVASPSRSLWGDGKSVALGGLSTDAALALLEQELGRTLEGDDRDAGLALVAALEGQALRILEVAAHLNETNQDLRSMAEELARGRAAALQQKLVESLDADQRAVLEVLTALGGATLPAAELGEITGVADAGAVVESLIAKGLVQAHSPRYSVTDGPAVARHLRPDSWDRPLVDYFCVWAERNGRTPEKVVDNSAAVLAVLDRAARSQAAADLLRLSRAVEGPFVLNGRWGAWKRTLGHELTAARRAGDRASEGWALHQLGTRALCVGQEFEARSRLTEALRIREALGDTDGAAITRHNLGLLSGGGGPRRPAAALTRAAPVVGGLSLLALLAVVVASALVVGGLVLVGAQTLGGGGGAGADVSALTMTPARHDFGERPALDPSPPRTVTVSNGTDDAVAVDAVTLVGAGEAFGVQSDTCRGATLDGGSACTLAVSFNAPQAGTYDARLVVRGGGRDGPSTSLHGLATPVNRPAVGPRVTETGDPTVIDELPPPPRPLPLPPPPCSLQLPGVQSVLYGAPLRLAAAASGSPTPSLAAQGLPTGLSLTDNGNGTGTISGTVLAVPRQYLARVTATAGGARCGSGDVPIAVAKAPVELTWIQPLLDITPGAPATARALVTQTAGTTGDLSKASVSFTLRNTLSGQVVDLGSFPVDSTGGATLQIAPGQVPAGAYTARARLVPNDYFSAASTPPVAVVVNTDVVGMSVYALSDALKNMPSF